LWALLAVLIGAGGLLSQASRGGATFTLSLPVTRAQVLWSRAGVGLAELAVLAIAPPLMLTVLSPLAGQSYSVTDALVHGLCLFLAGSTLFSATTLLSTILNDIWRPPVIVLCLAVVMQFARQLLAVEHESGLLGVMTGERYFRTGEVPVIGLLVTAALSAAMLKAATVTIARRDF
jgi:ABC-type transport system involved in multi-copper enzyme maturation permease subunit